MDDSLTHNIPEIRWVIIEAASALACPQNVPAHCLPPRLARGM